MRISDWSSDVCSSDLKWVHIHSAGLDRPIFGELQARGVEVTPSSGVNAQSVAHTAVAGVLALNRHFPQIMRQQAQRRWRTLASSASLPSDLDRKSTRLNSSH